MAEKTAMTPSPASTNPRVATLYRYPVKGLSGERLAYVDLEVGETFPHDRAFALENGPSGFDPAAPSWQPKIKFLCLMRNARLAALASKYDDKTGELAVNQAGETCARGDLATPAGRAAIERFFESYMGREARGKIRLLAAPGHSFSDLASKVVSIINLASLAELGRSLNRDVHPLRFRANLYIDGLAPRSELDLVGQTLTVGSSKLRVLKPTERCAATEVNPDSAERDIDVPEELTRLTGRAACGIYAEVTGAGRIAEGDPVVVAE